MNKALTSLDFLKEGETFPPLTQVDRLSEYAVNDAKFDGKLDIDRKNYRQLVQIVGNKFNVVSYNVLLNFYRLVSKKTADLLFIEHPKYVSEKSQNTVDTIVRDSRLAIRGWESAIDVDSKGVAIITAKLAGDKKRGVLGVSQPSYWYPVVSKSDAKEIEYHVLAWIVSAEDDKKELHYQIHEKGKYKQEARYIEGGIIGKVVDGKYEKPVIETGFSGFAVANVDGITTTRSIFGISSYPDMYSLVDELQARFAKIKHVLDKHSDPGMAGPTEALTFDEETGKHYFEPGQFFEENPENKGSLRYITWDGKIEGSYQEIEKIINILAVISEMGAAVFDFDGQSKELSGKAIRLLYTNALTKVKRIRNNFDYVYKQMIEMVSEVGYGDDVVEDLSITWYDGLPNDPKEDAEIAVLRTGGKPTDSQVSQIMKLDGLNEEDAKKRLAKINAETKERAASIVPNDDGEEGFFEDEE